MPVPPLYRQEKVDTCALACLRMILAFLGTDVAEMELEDRAVMESGGIEISNLQTLAWNYGLQAEIHQLDIEAITGLIASGVYPLVYLNRLHLDRRHSTSRIIALRESIVHAVIPIRVSQKFVTFMDPLPPGRKRRVSRRRFTAAQRDLAQWCLVCRRGSR